MNILVFQSIYKLYLYIFEENCETVLNTVGTKFLYPSFKQVIRYYCSMVRFVVIIITIHYY